MPDETEQTVPLKGENRLILNQETVREIFADWLNRKHANDPDVDVTDVYYEGNQFHVVTLAKD